MGFVLILLQVQLSAGACQGLNHLPGGQRGLKRLIVQEGRRCRGCVCLRLFVRLGCGGRLGAGRFAFHPIPLGLAGTAPRIAGLCVREDRNRSVVHRRHLPSLTGLMLRSTSGQQQDHQGRSDLRFHPFPPLEKAARSMQTHCTNDRGEFIHDPLLTILSDTRTLPTNIHSENLC